MAFFSWVENHRTGDFASIIVFGLIADGGLKIVNGPRFAHLILGASLRFIPCMKMYKTERRERRGYNFFCDFEYNFRLMKTASIRPSRPRKDIRDAIVILVKKLHLNSINASSVALITLEPISLDHTTAVG